MGNDVALWFEKKGINFFKEVGLKKGSKVVDFGCGEGNYSIPAAKFVGEKGKVFAVDKNMGVIEKMKQIAGEYHLKNIEFINVETNLPIEKGMMDFVMCYDMLHYLNKERRKKVYREVYRVLKEEGIFSVYPKHYKKDYPLWELSNMSLKDIIREIEEENFKFREKIVTECLHDTYLNRCEILNFIKECDKNVQS